MSFFCLIFSVGLVIQVAAVSSWVQIVIGRLVAGWG